MGEVCQELALPLESPLPGGRATATAQYLEGDALIEDVHPAGEVDLPHTANSQALDDFVRADARTIREPDDLLGGSPQEGTVEEAWQGWAMFQVALDQVSQLGIGFSQPPKLHSSRLGLKA
jgi:hypothetical protein